MAVNANAVESFESEDVIGWVMTSLYANEIS